MQFTLGLDKSEVRPVVLLDWFNGCRALVDTGALFPVWTAGEVILQSLGAKLIKRDVAFGGFGGKAYGALYVVDVKIGKLIFPNMPVVAHDLNGLNCHIILSAALFSGLIYEIDTVNNVLNINVPDAESFIRNLTFDNGKGGRIVLCTTQDNPSQIKI